MTSSLPHSNIRPWMIFKLSRTCNAAASTPRNGTFASVPVERLGRSMMTNNSAEESGPLVRARNARRVGDDARLVAVQGR